MKNALLALTLWTAGTAASLGAEPLELKSPDGNTVLQFAVRDFDGTPGCPVYRGLYQGRTVLADSRLGLELDEGLVGQGLTVAGQQTTEHDETWKPVCAERSTVRDHYRQLVVELKQDRPPRSMTLTFRAYDEGVAFCYTIPKQPGLESVRIKREVTEFRFPVDADAWATYSGQGVYSKVHVSQIKPGCERPLVARLADDLYAALAEARLVDYARMKFKPIKGVPGVESGLDGEVESALPLTTPWRVVMAAASPGRLLENNFLVLNLNDPCALSDTSWIKPGKAIREVTLTTVGGKTCVDFAVKHGLQYVEFDAGWYGHEYAAKSDASAVNLDPKRSKGPLDLHEVIRYAGERGIGIILYVNHLALEKQIDQVLPLYRSWGVKGVKYGFVNVGSQRWTAWLHEAIRKAAAQRLMVDIHDEYRPTGYSRTYPNLMTVEGILGDEAKPAPAQTTTYAFSRMLAGPADNTVCYYDTRVDALWTHAYQLAKPVVMFSPWEFLFWYDRPEGSPAGEGAGGSKPRLGDDPELEFFAHLPTVWDETKVLHGRIGEYAAIARRSGDAWFIGCLNAGEPRTLELPLSFLVPGKHYEAHVYSDDPTASTRTHVKIERREVTSDQVIQAVLANPGGMVIRVVPGK